MADRHDAHGNPRALVLRGDMEDGSPCVVVGIPRLAWERVLMKRRTLQLSLDMFGVRGMLTIFAGEDYDSMIAELQAKINFRDVADIGRQGQPADALPPDQEAARLRELSEKLRAISRRAAIDADCIRTLAEAADELAAMAIMTEGVT